jgi:hypothetical protein
MSQALFCIIPVNSYLCRPFQSFHSLQRISTMGDSIYNAEGGFSLTMLICFVGRWWGFEPHSPTNETQVINSLSLGQPLLRWVIKPSLRASPGWCLSERFQLLQAFQPTSYTLNLRVTLRP